MKVAMICFGDLAAPRNGYVLRCWMLACRLKKAGNDLTVYQFSDHEGRTMRDGVPIVSIAVRHEQLRPSRLEKFLSFQPGRELFFPIEGYLKLRKLRKELQAFDHCYVESCMLMNAFVFVKRLKKTLVLDTHLLNKDVALKLRDHNKLIGSLRVFIWHIIEKWMTRHADRVVAISDHDKTFMQKHYGVAADRIELIPHVVDSANAKKHQHEADRLRKELIKGYRQIACFIGDLGALQNIESEKYIREHLAPATPNIRYLIIGNNPRKLANTENITYTGFVDAIDPYILLADMCIAPMAIGSGVKTKVLDYLKYDKRIVATPVAVEGIDPSRHTHVCELAGFTDKIKELTTEGVTA